MLLTNFSLVTIMRHLISLIETGVRNLPLSRAPDELYEPVRYTLSLKGKRFRPLLLMMMNRLAGGKDDDAIHAALGIELLHTFTLMHDDIMDRAELRRGQPSVWSKYGSDTAILAGDLTFVMACREVTKVDAKVLAKTLHFFHDAARKLCEGQQMDLLFEGKDVSLDEYLEMVSFKTGSLLGAASAIGCLIGSGDETQAADAREFGVMLGTAFQIQDDILDTYGEQAKTGKAIGGDIAQNKKTYLLARASQSLTEEQKGQLVELRQSEKREYAVKQIRDLLDQTGIRAEAEMSRNRFFRSAMEILSSIPGDEQVREEIKQYCAELLERDH